MFVPITLPEYVHLYLQSNPGDNENEITERLDEALKAFRAGKKCHCGDPVWVIGSAEAGWMCLTCITGSTDNSADYELADACVRPRLLIPREQLPDLG